MVQTLWDATVSIVPLYYKLHSHSAYLHLRTFYLRFTHTPWIHQEQLRVQHLA